MVSSESYNRGSTVLAVLGQDVAGNTMEATYDGENDENCGDFSQVFSCWLARLTVAYHKCCIGVQALLNRF